MRSICGPIIERACFSMACAFLRPVTNTSCAWSPFVCGIVLLLGELIIDLGEGLRRALGVNLADDLLQHLLRSVLAFLRLWRADVEQQREPDDLPQQLQEFGLPVLERVAQHLDDEGIYLYRRAVGLLLVHKGDPAEHPVTQKTEGKKAERHPREPVLLPDRHCWRASLLLLVARTSAQVPSSILVSQQM